MKKCLLAVLMVLPMLVYAEECGQPDLTKPCMAWAKPADVMFWSLTALNAADYGTTRWGISIGGREVNQHMAGLVNHEPAFAIVKLGLGTGVSYLVRQSMRDQRKIFRWTGLVEGLAVAGLYFWVVQHNIGVANELKRRQQGDFR